MALTAAKHCEGSHCNHWTHVPWGKVLHVGRASSVPRETSRPELKEPAPQDTAPARGLGRPPSLCSLLLCCGHACWCSGVDPTEPERRCGAGSHAQDPARKALRDPSLRERPLLDPGPVGGLKWGQGLAWAPGRTSREPALPMVGASCRGGAEHLGPEEVCGRQVSTAAWALGCGQQTCNQCLRYLLKVANVLSPRALKQPPGDPGRVAPGLLNFA